MAVARTRYTYTLPRILLHVFLFLCACVVLGTAAYRHKHTRGLRGTHRSVVDVLLAASIVNLIWTPIAIWLLMRRPAGYHNTSNVGNTTNYDRTGTGGGFYRDRHPGWLPQTLGDTALAIFYLVPVAFLTNYYPNKYFRGSGLGASLLATLIAFSWICFGTLVAIIVYSLMHHASTRGSAWGGSRDGGQVMSTTGIDPNTTTTHGNTIGATHGNTVGTRDTVV
jgi:hypothetical protein